MTALAGEVPGGGGRNDHAMQAALRYHPQSDWHKACGVQLDQLHTPGHGDADVGSPQASVKMAFGW